MKIEDIHEAQKLERHLESCRKALEDMPSEEHIELQFKHGLGCMDFTLHHKLLTKALKDDIGRTKKALRELGVEFPEDKT